MNPGAYDFPGNNLDDDCDGTADNAVTDCSVSPATGTLDPYEHAKALDICRATEASATGRQRTWGLIRAELLKADGSGPPPSASHAIVPDFGPAYVRHRGSNMVLFSTGRAAAPSQPGWTADTPQRGTTFGQFTALPAGFPLNKAGCPTPSATGYDSVNIKLTLRVPTNANGLAFDHAFFTAEYPEDVCTARNDVFAALVDGTAPGIPANKNVVYDFSSPPTPQGVNSGFLDRCVAGATGCNGTVAGNNTCNGGVAELAGTGFEGADAQCGGSSSVGGGTGWLTTEAPVVPGETVVVQLMIWDSTDPLTDSMVLLDNFRWMQVARNLPITHR